MAEWEVLRERPSAQPVAPASPIQPATAPPAGAGGWEVLSERPSGADPATANALLERGRSILAQEESDIDYKTGAPYIARTRLQGARNPAEVQKEMERLYPGKGNTGQDRFGQWWVKEDGKRVAVLPKGLLGAFKNIVSGATSAPFTTAGGILGAAGGGVAGARRGRMPRLRLLRAAWSLRSLRR